LFEIQEGDLLRYRCRVGHAWSQTSLLAEQSVSMESALWMALRSLEEKAALARQMGERAHAQGHELTAAAFQNQCDDAQQAATMVRDLLKRVELGYVPGEAAAASDEE
jgi:two-component system chemotaxis response regulator CheB